MKMPQRNRDDYTEAFGLKYEGRGPRDKAQSLLYSTYLRCRIS